MKGCSTVESRPPVTNVIKWIPTTSHSRRSVDLMLRHVVLCVCVCRPNPGRTALSCPHYYFLTTNAMCRENVGPVIVRKFQCWVFCVNIRYKVPWALKRGWINVYVVVWTQKLAHKLLDQLCSNLIKICISCEIDVQVMLIINPHLHLHILQKWHDRLLRRSHESCWKAFNCNTSNYFEKKS